MTDDKIIELYEKRMETAIEETDRTYGRYFHSIAYGILWDHGDAEEVVNDTYLKAWNTIPPERPRHLKAFLARITRHLSINRMEQNTAKKRGAGQYELVLEELAECIPDTDGGEDMENLMALRDTLNNFLLSLPHEARIVFVRRYWHTQPIGVIAKELGMSESKIKSMLMRTRNKLKKTLTEEGYTV